jgi:hypothetical protein
MERRVAAGTEVVWINLFVKRPGGGVAAWKAAS